MNVDRRLPDGTRDDNEVTNKSQIYVNFLISVIIKKLIIENLLNCWEALT